jgi:phosphopantetheinyl transferase
MPLIEEFYYNHTKIGIWHIIEEEDFFATKYTSIKTITHSNNRLRHVAAWYTAISLANESIISPSYTSFGAPIDDYNQYNISLSHTKNIAVGAINPILKIGVDVEWAFSKAEYLHQKFANENEILFLETLAMPMQEAYSLLWSIKESAYKCQHQLAINYKQTMTLKRVELQPDNSYAIIMQWNNEEMNGIAYRIDDFWVTCFCKKI